MNKPSIEDLEAFLKPIKDPLEMCRTLNIVAWALNLAASWCGTEDAFKITHNLTSPVLKKLGEEVTKLIGDKR